jgi:CheY-like chemotaxis protein
MGEMMSELRRIFYVEDEPDIMAVAQVVLQDVGGFVLGTASSGSEALLVIQAFKPDLILLDVMMPGMDGPTTLQEIRKLDGMSEIPVCFMTAKVQPKEIEYYKALGAIDVIAKPFDPMKLSEQVLTIWNRHHGRQ